MPDKKPTNVIEALLAVMNDLPAIGKDEKASAAQGSYAYRGIEAITREAQGLFSKHGVLFAPRVVSHEIRDIVVNSKPWTDTVELVEYDVYGPGGIEDKIVVGPILAIGRDNADKGGNKCLTQAFKYALIQTFCISDSKDDADHGSPEADSRPTPEPVDPLKAKRAELGRIVTESEHLDPASAAELLGKWFGEGTKTADLDGEQLSEAIINMQLEARVRAEGAQSEPEPAS